MIYLKAFYKHCVPSLTCLVVDTDYSLHAGTREGQHWTMIDGQEPQSRAGSVEVTMCRVV